MEHRARILVLIAFAGVAAGLCPPPAAAKLFETRHAALVRIFGASARCEPRTIYLTEAQVAAARSLGKARVDTQRFTVWVATRADTLLGLAFLDQSIVRTMPATLLVAVTPDAHLLAVDVLAFDEPEDYLPPRRWLERLRGRSLSPQLRPGAEVDGITGATLSARAFTDAARRCLALATFVHPVSERRTPRAAAESAGAAP